MSPSRSHQNRQRRRLTATEVDLERRQQRALLVGTGYGTTSVEEAEASLDELALLTDTAGAEPVERVLQRRTTPDPATYIGKGKAEELRQLGDALDIDVVVFDDELTPAQQRNLEKLFKVDVVDRVALILDIFAQHATSQEGMVQVELAQLRYRLPRLRGRGMQLSQQAGGIGTRRGPGETQLEVDRRRLLRRVQKLERDLRTVVATRETQRKARRRRELSRVALVGYTNAGKSTLLNRLTNAGVLVEDQLFSTLDPTTRRLHLPGGETVLVSDTVGFVRQLPHQLVEAFRSTLEEVSTPICWCTSSTRRHRNPSCASTPSRRCCARSAPATCPRSSCGPKPTSPTATDVKRLVAAHSGSVAISAETGDGIEELLGAIGDRLRMLARVVEFVVPYDRGDVLAALHRAGEVLVEVHADAGTRVQARLPDASAGRFAEFSASATRDDR